MNDLLISIITGVVTFIATNIDDLVILLVFFAQADDNLQPWQIVLGQYLGFTILVILSLPGLLSGLIIPTNWISLLGLIPLSIGISSLVNQEKDTNLSAEINTEITPFASSSQSNFLNSQIYTIALITIANGSDNISVYIPLFSTNKLDSFLVIIVVFFLLLSVWCYAAYKLTHQKQIANFLTNYGSYFVPFVLMGLGVVIIYQNQALSPIKLLGICLCLLVLMKKN